MRRPHVDVTNQIASKLEATWFITPTMQSGLDTTILRRGRSIANKDIQSPRLDGGRGLELPQTT